MSERILLVGADWDSQSIPANAGWKFAFARARAEALVYLSRHRVDAVMVDEELPEIGGAAFLDGVMQQYPESWRFLRAAFSPDHARLKFVGIAHQVLAKPATAQMIDNALRRAFSFKTWLPQATVHKFLGTLGKLPSPPEIYFQVIKEIQSADASAESVGWLVGRDPVITAKLLQMANSAAFGLHAPITQATEAVVYLGMDTTKSMILLAHSFSYFDHFKVPWFRLEDLWGHSVAVGALSRRIAGIEGMSELIAGQSYTAGLLHDLGKLILAVNCPDLFSEAIVAAANSGAPLCQTEFKFFGATHAEVGAALLGIWGLPRDIIEAVALHHNPSRFLNPEFCPLTAVHAANVLCQETRPGVARPSAAELDMNYLTALKLSERVEIWREARKKQETPANA